MSALRAPRARARSAPTEKIGFEPIFGRFGRFEAPKMRLYPLTLALSPPFLDQLEPIKGSNRRKWGRGHRLVESGYMRKWKVAKIAVFEPRPTEARTFIFLYDLTPMLLKWPKENSKRAAPRR